ncbi:GumC family protein [Gloeothece verrucosa]|uniref:Lipopolysaccharide biosynthesis protein n=1 Tax=Gloeothece verrucosa (strain PCC 7822) TaxID=497965 RepID=E0UD42_GLOV7|nr:hypothetical protein [Gloeothece verrucosa]ADN12922.1 conserved hypothetical protein [Gloeothece verrucosa PCC 7822]
MAITSSGSVSQKTPDAKREFIWLRLIKYFTLAILANGALWGISFRYLKTAKPSYISEAILNVAMNSAGVSVNLPDIGQALTSNSSAFNSSSDPRENYKIIASSPSVLKAAAYKLKLSEEDFGEAKITIINNTTMLRLSLSANNPQLAQKKLNILYIVLTQRVNTLRQAEQKERSKSNLQSLIEAQKKLTNAQHRLSQYKARSGFNSSEQVKSLINNIEDLRKQRSEIFAQQQQTGRQLQQLSVNLNLSPQEAADALILQTDQQFQKTLTEYTTATTTLASLLPDRGVNYPDVVDAKQKQDAALQMMLERAKVLLNREVYPSILQRLNLDNSGGSGVKRAELFQNLITLSSNYQGLTAQVRTFTEQIKQLEARLNTLSQKELVLDDLLRELQISEAIFASTLAKVDLGKGDSFGAFPLIQMIEEPTLADTPASPKPKLVLAGSLIGSIFITLGLTLIWWRSSILTTTKRIVKEILA